MRVSAPRRHTAVNKSPGTFSGTFMARTTASLPSPRPKRPVSWSVRAHAGKTPCAENPAAEHRLQDHAQHVVELKALDHGVGDVLDASGQHLVHLRDRHRAARLRRQQSGQRLGFAGF